MKKTLFIKNAMIITVNTVILRLAGVVFRIWTAKNIGSEGMGLYGLASSVYLLCSTFASIGIMTTVMRTVSDCYATNKIGKAINSTKKSVYLCLAVCAVFIPLLFFGGNFLGKNVLGDSRTAIAVKLCGFSLPFMSVCSCLKGYFLAKKNTLVPCFSQLFEQAVRIAVIVFLINRFSNDLSVKIAIITVGDIFAEFAACLFLGIFWKKDIKGIANEKYPLRNILRIALPISGGKYINGLLRTYENILVPAKLTRYFGNKSRALSVFGKIKGMSLPILLFPYSIIGGLCSLLLPEISSSLAKGHEISIRYTVKKSISLTFCFSCAFFGIFFFLSDKISLILYSNAEIGKIIKLLSPIVPLMYVDSICDALLKGLDMQNVTFWHTVTDSVLRILLISLFLQKFGTIAFIVIMYASNVYTSGLNTYRIIKHTKTKINFSKTVFFPYALSFISGSIAKIISKSFSDNILYSAVFSFIFLCLYVLGLYISGCMDSDFFSIKYSDKKIKFSKTEINS